MGKVVERILANRVTDRLRTNNYFGGSQDGCLGGSNTITAIMDFGNFVGVTERRYVLGVFLDISGAFDNAWWPFIITSLRSHGCHGCPDDLLTLTPNYLRSRCVAFAWEEVCEEAYLTKGCPQGDSWSIVVECALRDCRGDRSVLILLRTESLLCR